MQRRVFVGIVGLIALVSAIGGLRAALTGPIAGDVVTVTDALQFGIQDNHTRFYAALWAGSGLLMGYALLALEQRRQLLYAMFFLLFFGGVGRLLHLDAAVLTTSDVAGAAAVELLGFPLLAWWLSRLEPEPAVA